MKLIIAGSRTLRPSFDFILSSIKMLGICDIEQIVSGGAEGVDSEAEHFASHMDVSFELFPYREEFGKAGGPIRNAEMAEYGDELLLIWNGTSRGSANMLTEMKKRGKPVYEIILKGAK